MQDLLPAKIVLKGSCGVYVTSERWLMFKTFGTSRVSMRVSVPRALMKDGSRLVSWSLSRVSETYRLGVPSSPFQLLKLLSAFRWCVFRFHELGALRHSGLCPFYYFREVDYAFLLLAWYHGQDGIVQGSKWLGWLLLEQEAACWRILECFQWKILGTSWEWTEYNKVNERQETLSRGKKTGQDCGFVLESTYIYEKEHHLPSSMSWSS